MIQIIKAKGGLLDQAEQLVREVFPWMSISERMSFRLYKKPHTRLTKLLLRMGGISSLSSMWVAVNENNEVCGTTGLYENTKDNDEAVWLSWFCVSPKLRGQGIGKQLLEFSISMAKNSGKKFLRLYTSDDANEIEAQGLYEKYGLKIVKEKQHTSHKTIYRELKL